MSRSSARNRHRPQQAAKARPAVSTSGTVYTPDQVAAMMAAVTQRGGMGGSLPRDPSWSQMPFGPGDPQIPAFINRPQRPGQQPDPRLGEYRQSYNLDATTHRHVPWKTLQDAADMPLFRKCIQRRKSVCELDFAVVVDPSAVSREVTASGGSTSKTDVESRIRKENAAEIARVTDWFQTPDRKNDLDWPKWTGLLMENYLKYDATVVYPRRTYGGELYSLEVPDGHLFKPLIDDSGGRPMPPFPAVQQILYGFPRGEWTADCDPEKTDPRTGQPLIPGGYTAAEILYERRIIRGHGNPYGMSPTEIALLDGLIWMRRMGWVLGEYTESSMPARLVESDNENGWDVTQWRTFLHALNEELGGNTAERLKLQLLPPGTHVVESTETAERYKPDYDMFLIKLVAGDFGMTATELGFPETGSLGSSFHEGEEDVLNRNTKIPDSNWLAGIATKLAVRQLNMPPVLKIKILGLESEDEAAADAVALAQVQSGRLTLNEDRARRGLPAFGFGEADMPLLMTARGIVFIEGASESAPPGMLVTPGQAPPVGGVDANGNPLPPQAPGAVPPGPQQPKVGKPGRAPDQPKPAPKPAAAAKSIEADVEAWKRWRRNGARRGQFACAALVKADAPPEMAADDRVLFKAAEPDPKVPGPGLAGTGTVT